MARIPPSLIRLRDETLEQGERLLWQGRPHAWTELRILRVAWWIGVPWIVLTGLVCWLA